jgi:hypothetical protein
MPLVLKKWGVLLLPSIGKIVKFLKKINFEEGGWRILPQAPYWEIGENPKKLGASAILNFSRLLLYSNLL